jgi:DNA-binding IclR family transcriptional regulator
MYTDKTSVLYTEVMIPNIQSSTRKKYEVPSVEQAARIMLYLADCGNSAQSLTNICKEVGIHTSKAFSILSTLQEYNFIKKHPNRGGYVLGPGLLILTGKILESLSLPKIAEPILTELAKKANATAAVGLISDDKTYVVAQYEGALDITISPRIGYTTSITHGAHGKAIAAFLPRKELETLLQKQDLYFYGSPEKLDKSKLEKELAQCRQDGFALELGDIFPGVNAIGVPLLDQNNKPIGYITLVGFFTREEAKTLGPAAVEAARKLSRETGNMTYWRKS